MTFMRSTSIASLAILGWFCVAACAGQSQENPGVSPPAPTVLSTTPSVPTDSGSAAAPPPATPKTDVQRCESGDKTACDKLAEFWGGRPIVADKYLERGKLEAKSLSVACDERDVSSACMGLALMYKYGSATGQPEKMLSKKYWARVADLQDLNGFLGKPKSEAGAKAMLATDGDCSNNRPRACNQLGWAAYGGIQRDVSFKDSLKFYTKACELGSAQGCHWSGHLAYTYPELKKSSEAEQLLEKSCQLGFPDGCDELAVVYAKRKKNEDKIEKLYQQACDEGSRSGCAHLGEQIAAKKDDASLNSAFSLFGKSCRAGDGEGCFQMGQAMRAGKGTKKDEESGWPLIIKSCEREYEEGCEFLGKYLTGGGPLACGLKPQVKVPKTSIKPAIVALKNICAKPTPHTRYCQQVERCKK
jgi:TPR repeat protein